MPLPVHLFKRPIDSIVELYQLQAPMSQQAHAARIVAS